MYAFFGGDIELLIPTQAKFSQDRLQQFWLG